MNRIGIIFLCILFVLQVRSIDGHMGLEPPFAVAGDRVIVTLRIGHDCGDDTVGTTNFTVILPPRLPSVKVEQMGTWRVFINKMNETVDGEEMEYVKSVTWMGFLPDGFYQLFNIRIKMPDTPGEALWFKGYQDCHNQGDSIAWEMIPSEDNPKPRYPARNITLVSEEMMDAFT